MVNDRCLCPVAASTHQVGAPSLSAMIRWFVDGSLLIGKSHMQSGWEAAVSLVNASPADSTAWQATGRIWTQAPGYKHTQSGEELYIRLILLKLFTLWKFHIEIHAYFWRFISKANNALNQPRNGFYFCFML